MANPQPDQFTRISNEIMDALCKIRIPGEARQVFDFIVRKTWGFNKVEDEISLSQFAEGTNLPRRNVVRALKKLSTMNLVVKNDTTYTNIYKVQKDYELWEVVSETTPSVKSDTESGVIFAQSGVESDTESGVKSDTYKRKKDNTKEKKERATPKNKNVDNLKSPIERFNNFISDRKNTQKIVSIVESLWYWGVQPEKWLKEQVRTMRAWIIANPRKANKSDWLKFTGGWLRREYKKNPPNKLIDPMTSNQEQQHYDSHKNRTGGGFKKIGDLIG